MKRFLSLSILAGSTLLGSFGLASNTLGAPSDATAPKGNSTAKATPAPKAAPAPPKAAAPIPPKANPAPKATTPQNAAPNTLANAKGLLGLPKLPIGIPT